MPIQYRFETDGAYVNFYADAGRVARLHNSSRHVQWSYKDNGGINFTMDDVRYQLDLSQLRFNGVGISEQAQFETKIIELFPGLAGGEGGGGGDPQNLADVLGEGNDASGLRITNLADPESDQDAATKKYVDDNIGGGAGIDDVLGEEQDLSENRTINVNGNSLDIKDGEVTRFGVFPGNTSITSPDGNTFIRIDDGAIQVENLPAAANMTDKTVMVRDTTSGEVSHIAADDLGIGGGGSQDIAQVLTEGNDADGNTLENLGALMLKWNGEYDEGSEVITNGGFTGNASGWTLGTGWAYGSNNVSHTPGNTDPLSQDGILTISQKYLLRFTIGGSAGTVNVALLPEEGSPIPVAAGSGAVEIYGSAPAADLIFAPDTDFNGTIDDVSIKLATRKPVAQILNGDDDVLLGVHLLTPSALQIVPDSVVTGRGKDLHIGAGSTQDDESEGGDLWLRSGMINGAQAHIFISSANDIDLVAAHATSSGVDGSGIVSRAGNGFENTNGGGVISEGGKGGDNGDGGLIQIIGGEGGDTSGAGGSVTITGGASPAGTGGSLILQAGQGVTDGAIIMSGIPVFADNAAASGGGLGAGSIYRTGDVLKIVH